MYSKNGTYFVVIKVIDNFFEDKMLENIMNHIKTNCTFTPRFFEDFDKNNPKFNYSEDNKTTPHWGDRYPLESDKNLLDTFVKQAEKKFKIKIKKLGDDCGIDLRNMDYFHPHQDDALINILIMLEGPTAVTNGTVFYTNGELDMHVGFRPNRSIMFPSKMFHSPHASKIKGMRRYTSTLFVAEYEGG
jgi:hypothetical protein